MVTVTATHVSGNPCKQVFQTIVTTLRSKQQLNDAHERRLLLLVVVMLDRVAAPIPSLPVETKTTAGANCMLAPAARSDQSGL